MFKILKIKAKKIKGLKHYAEEYSKLIDELRMDTCWINLQMYHFMNFYILRLLGR